MKIIQDENGLAVRFINGTILFVKCVRGGSSGQNVHVVDIAGECPPALTNSEIDKFILALRHYRALSAG